MLDTLFRTLGELPALLGDSARWDSLIVNRRKPHTYRVFTRVGDLRVCLHKFNACDRHEAFPHPHPWPGAFVVLDGAYRMTTGRAPDLHSPPVPGPEFLLARGSAYEITDPLTFHAVVPLADTYTVMVNGPEWPAESKHVKTVTTKGKDLDKLSEEELEQHLVHFKMLVGRWLGESSFGA